MKLSMKTQKKVSMAGIKQKERIEIAFTVLKRTVNQYSKSFYDPSELESIGYVVIAEQLNKRLRKKCGWEGYIDICLRNAFLDYIRRENFKNKYIKYL